MSEPEEVILDGAHHATTTLAALWHRRSGAAGPAELHLAEVRGRLELLTRAVFEHPPPIGVAEPPSIPNWFGRIAKRIPKHLVRRHAVASTDGARVRLPGTLDATAGWDAAFTRYRILAVGLSAKATRGTADLLGSVEDPLTRDLYLLSEAAAVDAWIVTDLPGLWADVTATKATALGRRPTTDVLTPAERRLEELLRTVLGGDAGDDTGPVPLNATPRDSLTWAHTTRQAFLRDASGGDIRYRGLPPVDGWGTVHARPRSSERAPPDGGTDEGPEPLDGTRVRTLVRRPRVRHAPEDEDDDEVGMWMVQIDDPQESVEDPMGLQRPTDRDDEADPGELADSLSELPEARLVPLPGRPNEVLASEDPPDRNATVVAAEAAPVGIAYPEWDWRTERYRPKHAVVREREAPAGDITWVEQALKRYAREVRRVRRQFERLRPQRVRLGRQPDGPDIDLGAYVTAYADQKAGHAVDDRLYEQILPARRDLSILLLVDVSGSTDSWVADTRRIIDVEKEALLLVCEALDALGDGYAVMGFSGEGPRGVSAYTVKRFAERNGPLVRQRIAALEPDRFTRAGAAIRHATAALTARSTRHRLLLVLSDGKPNDIDLYEGRYGVEDTRQAVAEARLEGIEAFCVTVDRQAPVYLSRIFGPSGYAVLRHAATLPGVLVDVVRMLLRS
ncbi:MAG: VWA domain-containing protein [Gemmatimonadota bacterium]|nr:VWA domain-containing protein [Gemmatimonadota bacterium]